MDFLLFAVRSIHLFGVVVWFGGLMYQEVVVFAAIRGEGGRVDDGAMRAMQAFVPFIWMSFWTIVVTGVALMLFSPHYVFLQFETRWSILLAAKQGVFLMLTLFTIGQVRMIARMSATLGTDAGGDRTLYFARAGQFCRLNIFLGLVALILASAMH
jgi:uncharacterized membrane protein